MNELEYKLRNKISKINYKKGMKVDISVDKIYTIKIDMDNSGSKIEFNLNIKYKECILNVYSISGHLYIEDGLFCFDKSENKFNEVNNFEINEFDSSKIELILRVIRNELSFKVKSILLKESGLSVVNNESKFVWLNTMDGFSETWFNDEFGFGSVDEFLCSLSDTKKDDIKHWKLIEYKCHNEHLFEFNSKMKLK